VEKAREIHHTVFPLLRDLFVETNPIPVKAAMNWMGLAAGEPRLPLVPLGQNGADKLRRTMESLGLL